MHLFRIISLHGPAYKDEMFLIEQIMEGEYKEVALFENKIPTEILLVANYYLKYNYQLTSDQRMCLTL